MVSAVSVTLRCRYYKKQDLDFKKLNISTEDLLYIGENEVFFSNHHDKIYVDCIFGKCKVYSIQEYDELETIDNLTYFNRANYNPFQKVLDPPFKDWEAFCVCQKPLNPNLLYIKCDECSKWYHPKCMGLTEDEAQKKEEFYCTVCMSSKKKGDES